MKTRLGLTIAMLLTIGLHIDGSAVATQDAILRGPGELVHPVVSGVTFRGNRNRGTILVQMEVQRDGLASDVEVLEGIDSRTDSRVVRGVRGARHRPATLDGVPVRYLMTFALRLEFGPPATQPVDTETNRYLPVGMLVDRHPALDARRVELATVTERGDEGRAWVLVGVLVGEDGRVTETRLLHGVDPDIDAAILHEIGAFRYTPARLGDEPTTWALTVRYPVVWRF